MTERWTAEDSNKEAVQKNIENFGDSSGKEFIDSLPISLDRRGNDLLLPMAAHHRMCDINRQMFLYIMHSNSVTIN